MSELTAAAVHLQLARRSLEMASRRLLAAASKAPDLRPDARVAGADLGTLSGCADASDAVQKLHDQVAVWSAVVDEAARA